MIFSVLLIFKVLFFFSTATNAHDNSEQHAIVHVYPLLELEYMKALDKECKMEVLQSSYCKSNSSNNEKIINK